jgi:hypothetical protein
MQSSDGSRRRDPRPSQPPSERRSPREPEALEQRLDRWVSTGRQLVEGVSGGRPGGRQGNRSRPEGRQGSRGGFDGLGRWVENRLDWLLDDSDDWPEPWQQGERRPGDSGPRRPARPTPARPVSDADRAIGRSEQPRRRLDAISRRQLARPSGATARAAAEPAADPEAWPDESLFNVPRWQRPSPPQRRPDPLQLEPGAGATGSGDGEPSPGVQPARPLPRSSRRR